MDLSEKAVADTEEQSELTRIQFRYDTKDFWRNGGYCTDGVSNNAKIQEEMMEEMLQKVNDLSALSKSVKRRIKCV